MNRVEAEIWIEKHPKSPKEKAEYEISDEVAVGAIIAERPRTDSPGRSPGKRPDRNYDCDDDYFGNDTVSGVETR
jgi:hypothetical protein